MKKNHFLSTAFMLAILFFITKSFGQTTQEEYNYITKGYKAQVIEQGGDMKKGYELVELDKASTQENERKVTIKKFNRVAGTTKKLAAYMLIYERTGVPVTYFCIPTPGSDKALTELFWSDLYNGTGDNNQKLQLISYLLSQNLK